MCCWEDRNCFVSIPTAFVHTHLVLLQHPGPFVCYLGEKLRRNLSVQFGPNRYRFTEKISGSISIRFFMIFLKNERSGGSDLPHINKARDESRVIYGYSFYQDVSPRHAVSQPSISNLFPPQYSLKMDSIRVHASVPSSRVFA